VHLRNLSADDMKGRRFASKGSIVAQKYIISSLTKGKVNAFQQKFLHPFSHKTLFSQKNGHNIIGYVEGTKFPHQYIVLSAHYDHLGEKHGNVFNGADDNASGTAALLTFANNIARKPLQHSVLFLFTDGEEVNLLGAKAFIAQQNKLLPRIRLNINLDMIAGNKNTSQLHYIDRRLDNILSNGKLSEFAELSANQTIKVKRGFKQNNSHYKNKVRWYNASDHGEFNREHIPFIYFGVGVHNNYHSVNDDFDRVNLTFFIKACRSIFQYLYFLDRNITPLQE